jgi:hypothetical protein
LKPKSEKAQKASQGEAPPEVLTGQGSGQEEIGLWDRG